MKLINAKMAKVPSSGLMSCVEKEKYWFWFGD